MSVDFGARMTVVRLGGVSLRFGIRALVVSGILVVATLAIAVLGLTTGDFQLTVQEVLSALAGQQQGIIATVVLEWRLPRIIAGVAFGAALGLSGAIFQSLTRNPLASPDVIGFSAGSYTGALIVIILVGGSYLQVAVGSIVGGIATAALVYVFAYRKGVQGFRLIIVGIAVSAMLGSLNTFLILRAKVEIALTASVWGVGTLATVGWQQLLPALVTIAIMTVALIALGPARRQLELGDDAASALGVRVEPVRLALVVTGVALIAVVTAAAGPIAFVALAAPQVARILTRSAGVSLVPAAVTGAFLLAGSDAVAAHAFPEAVPVGLVTVVTGGIYLIWLLIHEARRRT